MGASAPNSLVAEQSIQATLSQPCCVAILVAPGRDRVQAHLAMPAAELQRKLHHRGLFVPVTCRKQRSPLRGAGESSHLAHAPPRWLATTETSLWAKDGTGCVADFEKSVGRRASQRPALIRKAETGPVQRLMAPDGVLLRLLLSLFVELAWHCGRSASGGGREARSAGGWQNR